MTIEFTLNSAGVSLEFDNSPLASKLCWSSIRRVLIYGIPVTDKILRLFIHAAGLDKLLCSSGSGRMIGDIEMKD